jgi:hypothetical protein
MKGGIYSLRPASTDERCEMITEQKRPSIRPARPWHGPLVLAVMIAALALTIAYVLAFRIG